LVFFAIQTKEHHMNRNTSVSLGPHFVGFIEAQVKDGRYGTASDVVRAGLRLLEEHEVKVKALQDALQAGLDSGEPRPFDSETFLARMRAKHG
jgi:antitoxin ParD1/3/4